MTPDELASILGGTTDILSQIMSFGLGGLCALAFILAASMRWDR